MSKLATATGGVIWEQCIKFEKCIHIPWPINKDVCVSVTACMRLIDKNGTIVLQVEAGGNQFEFNLTNACHTIFSVGVGHVEVCISANGPNSVRLQARACIGYGPINQCWDIWGTDIHWLTAAEFNKLDHGLLGFTGQEAKVASGHVAFVDEYLAVDSPCACEGKKAA